MIDTESKMDFDRTLSTEERFAFRKWFQEFIHAQNSGNEGELGLYLADMLKVEGFLPESMGPAQYAEFLIDRSSQDKKFVTRYPSMKVSFRHFLFHMRGTFEGYTDNILSHEGTIEVTVVKQEEGFKLLYQKFYPRLMVA